MADSSHPGSTGGEIGERPGDGAGPVDTDTEAGGRGLSRRGLIQAAGVTAGALSTVAVIHASPAEAVPAGAGGVLDEGRAVTTPSAAVAPVGDHTPQVQSGHWLTTNQGLRVSDDRDSLRAGLRGPTLLEDFHFREKIMHFDHERIPERVVHARGAGAHGSFTLHRSLASFTSAAVLTEVGATTEVFARFSTVLGSRGSADTARDVRGFAVKFYTGDDVWDFVGNDIPVFFIQDAIKFPDLIHAGKPEPDVEIPQAQSAHNTFWDFISLTPESAHMIMWVMSDRGIPRSYRMMEGFGVHTFRLVNAAGRSTFVKFYWKPALGVHSLVWNEAQKLAGFDPDYHRRDLAQAIDAGAFPQWDLGVQLLAEKHVARVGFDVLDSTKLWPEEVVPVEPVGTMILDRNPANYFAETEQVAFHLGHVVQGIDFTDDPLLQGRLFSYLDTQINRFGSANFSQLPINAPRAPVNNYQQDSAMRYANRTGIVNYEPNTLGGNAHEAPASAGGYVSYPEQVSGPKVRGRSPSFGDHFSQATLFFRSLTEIEKQHVVQALQFELAKVSVVAIQKRVLTILAQIDARLVHDVALALGLPAPAGRPNARIGTSPALSQERHAKDTAKTRRVAILAADGVDGAAVAVLRRHLAAAVATADVVAPHLGTLTSTTGAAVKVDKTLLTTPSVVYDAVCVPGGAASVATLRANGDALHFVEETYRHYKPIAATTQGSGLVTGALVGSVPDVLREPGVLSGSSAETVAAAFVGAIAQHRFWARRGTAAVSARALTAAVSARARTAAVSARARTAAVSTRASRPAPSAGPAVLRAR